MLAKLLPSMNRHRFRQRVVCLSQPGKVAGLIKDSGFPVDSLDMRHGRLTLAGLRRLGLLIRRTRPNLLQTWLYHADLLGMIAGRLGGVRRVCWNLRCSFIDLTQYRLTTRLVLKFCARISPYAHCIISNSRAGMEFHRSLGYRNRRWQVIPNGFDLDRFRPIGEARERVLQELNLATNQMKGDLDQALSDRRPAIIGYVARFDPMKDHATFIHAAKKLIDSGYKAHFVLVGRGVNWNNSFFQREIPPRIRPWFHLLGERTDIPRITAAFDIATSASFGEGFSNVICEAMACKVPCVVTNVGDSAEIVGDSGMVIPPKNPQKMADAWRDMIGMGIDARNSKGARARQRVAQRYSLQSVASAYEQLYQEMTFD